MTVNFIEGAADPNKGFRMGREQSLFQNNVVFTITGVKFGNYEIRKDDGTVEKTKYASTAQSILLTTSIGEDLPLNRLLHKTMMTYKKNGDANPVPACTFRAPLRDHMETLGRRDTDSAMLNGTVKEVGDHALKFFEGKSLVCKEVEGFGRDNQNKLVPLISPCIQFSFKD